jgi:hypothetical protein
VVTRSVMKELRSSIKSLVRFDKFKKRALFKIRVDVCRRAVNNIFTVAFCSKWNHVPRSRVVVNGIALMVGPYL